MVCLALIYKKKQVFSAKKIAEKEGVPFDFLEKIVSQLEKAKLVKGKKGVQGGYILAKSPQKISVGDILRALEGKSPIVDCVLCQKSKKCAAKQVWAEINTSFNKTLNSIKLSKIT